MADSAKVVKALLEKHGRTFSRELGIKLESNTPSALFRWLCAALLFSARISNRIAMEAARALTKHGWTSARKMAAATWKERTVVLNRAGYARYDEKTSRMLADTSKLLLDRYKGDLRKLREEAKRDSRRERNLIKECKGIGEVGASIFFREVQVVWPEQAPFADKVALRSAGKLGLPTNAEGLAKLVSEKEFPRLLAALVRCELAKDHGAIRGA
jgi:thermostable 8-oxoguanine DNA glycosylase